MGDFELSGLVSDEVYQYKGKGFSHKLPSGIPTLDIALGGGLPLDGSIVEIWGEEGHGKTTLSYRLCKRCTDDDGYVTWIDDEVSYDKGWAAVQGVNVDRIIPYRPPYMERSNDIIIGDIKKYKEQFLPWLVDPKWKPSKEQADAAGLGVSNIEGIKKFMEDNAPPHVIVWDSLAASPVKSVAEEAAEYSSGIAYRARLIKSFLSRYMVAVVGCSKICMILINQVIDNIGSMYGPAITTPGGRGLRHGKHLSIYVKRSGSGEKDAENFKITDYVMISLTKNKVTPVIASFPIIFSKARGFLGATSVLEYLWNIQWFKSAGAWKKFEYTTVNEETGEISKEEISFQRGNFYELMEKRPELFNYLCYQIKEQLIEKFPTSQSLRDTDMNAVIEACLNEASAMPDEEELDSLNS